MYAITNNYAVDPNYRLGMTQVYNLNVQKTLPLQTVFNIGYNGTKASGLDIYGTPERALRRALRSRALRRSTMRLRGRRCTPTSWW